MRQDINEIKKANFESIIKGLITEPIFREIQEHIIREPFLRRNFSIIITLKWKDEPLKDYLELNRFLSYEIENISQIPGTYILRSFEEKKYEDKFPGNTAIEEIKVQKMPFTDDAALSIYSGESLKKYIDGIETGIYARIPIVFNPSEKAKINVKLRTLYRSSDSYTFCLESQTVQLQLTVMHPSDLKIELIPLHPAKNAFINELDELTMKRWRSEVGFLPFQGFVISWQPAC